MRSFFPLGLLVLFSVLFSTASDAKNVPSLNGVIENHSKLSMTGFEVEVIGSCKAIDVGGHPNSCGRVAKRFAVNEKGEFKTASFAYINTGSSIYKPIFSYSVRLHHGSDIDWELKTDEKVQPFNLVVLGIEETKLKLLLPDGSDATSWIQNVLPEGKLEFSLSLSGAGLHPLGQSLVNNYNVSLTKAELPVPSQFIVLKKSELLASPLTLKLTYTTPLNRVVFRYSGEVTKLDASLLDPVKTAVLDDQGTYQGISGQFEGDLLLHDLGPVIQMAIDNSKLVLDLECRNGVLEGSYTNSYENSYSATGKILGNCTQFGKGQFTVDLLLKGYLETATVLRKLNFEILGVDGAKVKLVVDDVVSGQRAGWLAQW